MIKSILHKIPGKAMFDFMSEFRKLDNKIQAQTVQTFFSYCNAQKGQSANV